jgi:hypothetical protein
VPKSPSVFGRSKVSIRLSLQSADVIEELERHIAAFDARIEELLAPFRNAVGNAIRDVGSRREVGEQPRQVGQLRTQAR